MKMFMLCLSVLFIFACEGPIGPEGLKGIQGEPCELIIPSITGTWIDPNVTGDKKVGLIFFADGTAMVGYLLYKDSDFLGHIPLYRYTYDEEEQVGYLKQGDDFYKTGKKFTVVSDSLLYEGRVFYKDN